ncbi:hypothetical protein CYLTODRAFT_456171 [Cylindrobasidium torrendii FP15055 ss-10]|uniref:Uncharacterized protein n=1 Tax=Cylindrobasidium torrendii FP15055 ss-10 TaxID=1314674 RepID=A0A0D7B7S5_9AGAR|nr:hypothetical protein CYLTODRAFT_456171 [Cylindrobasidium torrendii FP15055 ss-10]
MGPLAAAESAGSKGGEGGSRTYIIPRKSGQVIIGGTREVNDWSEIPDPSTALDIKMRALDLFPELSPKYNAANSVPPKPEDLDSIVLADVVGLRPSRRDGLRLNRGEDMVLQDSRVVTTMDTRARDGWHPGDVLKTLSRW